jgi:membrane protein DedA with SNARE-associated domain
MDFDILLNALSFLKLQNPDSVLQFLQTSGYLIMFVLMTLEGPIVSYVSAFLASLDVFNIYYVAILSFFGNVLGDVIFFSIGRIGKKLVVERFVTKTLSTNRTNRLGNYLKENPGKAITVIKLTPPLPIPGLILTGASDVSFKKFFIYSSIVSLGYTLFIVLLGFYSGMAFAAISKYVRYIDILIGVLILMCIGIFFLIKYVSRKISKRFARI